MITREEMEEICYKYGVQYSNALVDELLKHKDEKFKKLCEILGNGSYCPDHIGIKYYYCTIDDRDGAHMFNNICTDCWKCAFNRIIRGEENND